MYHYYPSLSKIIFIISIIPAKILIFFFLLTTVQLEARFDTTPGKCGTNVLLWKLNCHHAGDPFMSQSWCQHSHRAIIFGYNY